MVESALELDMAAPDRRFTAMPAAQDRRGTDANLVAAANSGVVASFKHLDFTPLTTFNRVTSSDTNENDGCSTNGKMIAVAWNAAASVAVFNAETPLTFDA